MMRVIFLVLAVWVIHGAARASAQVDVRFTPVANLVYQLDCVSGADPSCSLPAFKDLWEREFLRSEQDRSELQAWGNLADRYSTQLRLSKGGQPAESVQLNTKLRFASFQATSLEDYFAKLDLVVTPRDQRKFEKIIRHFYPAFERWWKSEAQSKGRKFAKRTNALLKSTDINKRILQFAQFYEAELSEEYSLPLNLIYHPGTGGSTKASQIENYAVAEFLRDEKPEERIDVIIHEMCHFFFGNAAAEKLIALEKSFVNSGKLAHRGGYNLLNETLATAFGNGLINKLHMSPKEWESFLARERSLYNEYFIDNAAKTILSWVETWLEGGKTLHSPGFAMEYTALLESAFGRELEAPSLVLREMLLVGDSKYGARFSGSVRKSLLASGVSYSEGEWSDKRLLESYKLEPELGTLFIVHPSNIHQLGKNKILPPTEVSQIQTRYKKDGQVIYSFKRSPTVPGYILIAPGYEGAVALMEKFGALKKGFAGFYEN